jgi:serine O-acetyltransferase
MMPQNRLFLCKPDRETSPLLATVWGTLCAEALVMLRQEPALSRMVNSTVFAHGCFAEALADRLVGRLASPELDQATLYDLMAGVLDSDPGIAEAAGTDLTAIRDRDPATQDLLGPFLNYKGFHALQAHRVTNWLWRHGRTYLALHLQSRVSEVFAIDIHPAATMGRGILLDHGTSLVIGETAVVEDDVSILQEVTLGGTGKECGDRHPKVRRGVLIGAGAKILGNIEIGEGAKIGAGSVVLDSVEPYTTVAGVPARPVGLNSGLAGLTMDHALPRQDFAI